MKNTFKKITASIMAVASLTVGVTGMSAGAAGTSTTNSAQGQNSFSSSWSAIWYFDCGNYAGSMTIGFDTWWTDEDYVNYFGTKNGNHYAAVKNSSGDIEYTDTASSGSSTGKADVKHTGTPVTYYAFWAMP